MTRANADCVVRWNSGQPGAYATGAGCQSGETLTSGGCTVNGTVESGRGQPQAGVAYSYPAPNNWNQNGSAPNGTWQCVATHGIGNGQYDSNISVSAYALCCR
jgi:hypothetical protein